MIWDPDRYLHFTDHRLRPGIELIARIPGIEPARAIDLGCGPGNLTAIAAARWPQAKWTGLDSSETMLELARSENADIEWTLGSVTDWEPTHPYDLILSNAALHWIDDHQRVFRRLAESVSADGVLAVQMPDNWSEPTHRIPAAILDDDAYGGNARRALLRDRVASPASYRRWIGPTFDFDIWTTTYQHVLTGTDPVLSWVSGSVLRPVLDRLEPGPRERFLAECADGYTAAYPVEPDGTTVLPFRRLFIVARRR